MHIIQRGTRRPFVFTVLQDNPPGGDGFVARVAETTFRRGVPLFLVDLGEDLAAQARRLAERAPPRVLYPLIASVRMPYARSLVGLPAGEAIFVEDHRDRIVANVLRTDGVSVTFHPFAGLLLPPPKRSRVDWAALDADTWGPDEEADAAWSAWAEANVHVAPFKGTTAPTGEERASILRANVLPSLAALAMTASPALDRKTVSWGSLRDGESTEADLL